MLNKITLGIAISAAFVSAPALTAGNQDSNSSQNNQQSAQNKSQPAEGNGATVYLSPKQVLQVQKKLNKIGYSVEKVNGKFSGSTARAVKNYQQKKGLAATGTFTVAFLQAIGISNLLQGGSANEQSGNQSGGQNKQSGQHKGQNNQRSQQMIGGSGAPIYIGPMNIRLVQRTLNKKGYGVGAVDGIWGPSTAGAARNYEQSNHLPTTDNLDTELIQSLGLQKQVFSSGNQGSGESKNKQRPITQQVTGNGTPLHVGPRTIQRIEQKLNKQGQHVSQQGDWNADISQAVRSYQKSHGLESTGTITTTFLKSIGMSNWQSGGSSQGGQTGQTQNTGQSGQSNQNRQEQQSQSGKSGGGQSSGQSASQANGGQSSGQSGQSSQGGGQGGSG